jgi:hypothetical protein
MIHFPASISPLAPVTPFSQTDRIAAEVAVSVGFLPDLAVLSFSHVFSPSQPLYSRFEYPRSHIRDTAKQSLLGLPPILCPAAAGT